MGPTKKNLAETIFPQCHWR